MRKIRGFKYAVSTNKVMIKMATIPPKIKQILTKYGTGPENFFVGDQPNEVYLETLIAQHISTDPQIRFGKACIRGTRIAVIDVVGDTCHLGASADCILQLQYRPVGITREQVAAAYAYLLKNPERVSQEFVRAYGDIPPDLYK